ncbi:MAG: hypothetical protein DRZ76_03440 [Candidatus Nealsonbacteria bacterium]|nr:MAG: hypothetical protein DRZ76_03440 [Candidatus Nealsonbacteria bacterium]
MRAISISMYEKPYKRKNKTKTKEKKRYAKNWLTYEEYKKLISLRGKNVKLIHKLLIRFTWSGALRINEALQAKPEYLIEENNRFYYIIPEQKTDKRNWEKQPIDQDIYNDLMDYIELRKIRFQDYIFTGYKGTPFDRTTIYLALNRYAKMAGINKRIGNHTLRRSRALFLLNYAKRNIFFVKEFLRHKNIQTTLKYLKIDKSELYDQMLEAEKKAESENNYGL